MPDIDTSSTSNRVTSDRLSTGEKLNGTASLEYVDKLVDNNNNERITASPDARQRLMDI